MVEIRSKVWAFEKVDEFLEFFFTKKRFVKSVKYAIAWENTFEILGNKFVASPFFAYSFFVELFKFC